MKHVYTIEDLRSGKVPENAKLAVIGYPIKHSASPQMHQKALDALGIDLCYIRVEVSPGRVGQAFKYMQALSFIGCNVTIPHKLEAMEQCDQLSQSVETLGVANTITFKNDKILGHNTDGPGLVKALKEDLDFIVKGSRILVLGAGGGAGKAIATQLASDGCAELYLSNRTVEKVVTLAGELAQYPDTHIQCLDNSEDALKNLASKVDLIINATSLGMRTDDAPPFPLDSLTSHHKVYDAIYNPKETQLLRSASEVGAATANGLSMLVHQGALSFEMWTGQAPDVGLMKSAIS